MQINIKKYFSLYKKMTACKQFNRKVELNQEINRFKHEYQIIIVPTQTHDKKILCKGVHVATMKYNYEAHKTKLWNFDPQNYTLSFTDL